MVFLASVHKQPLGGTESELAKDVKNPYLPFVYLIEPQKNQRGREHFPFKEGYCFLVKKNLSI